MLVFIGKGIDSSYPAPQKMCMTETLNLIRGEPAQHIEILT